MNEKATWFSHQTSDGEMYCVRRRSPWVCGSTSVSGTFKTRSDKTLKNVQ